MRRLVLHIGLEKTGTTSFQAFCADNRAALAARGALYPANAECFLRLNHAPLAASYFIKYRAAAIGSVNFSYGIGGFYAPILASAFLVSYKTWRAPMIAFGLFGFVTLALILLFVRSWFSETHRTAEARKDAGGASTLLNWNSGILTILSMLHGFSMYGFLGMYTLYLREGLHYPPRTAAGVIGFFGVGALASIFCGWVGDRFSPRIVLAGAFLCSAVLGYLFFHGASVSRLDLADIPGRRVEFDHIGGTREFIGDPADPPVRKPGEDMADLESGPTEELGQPGGVHVAAARRGPVE